MALLHLTQTDYSLSRWSGGTTTQVAIMPADAVYARRDFLWRISSAGVELEESDFTALPDYDRWISTVQGEMRLTHNGGPVISLSPYQVHAFDGGADTHSWGQCTDFNLMLRKGLAAGELRPVRLTPGSTETVTCQMETAFPRAALLLFCGEGSAAVALGDQALQLHPMEAALLEDAASQTLRVSAEGAVSLLLAEVHW